MEIDQSLRLRQICLVAWDIDLIVYQIRAIFDVEVCHRDSPTVSQWGVRNALLPFGPTFLEVVSPAAPNTNAERYLKRRGGDGGYMAIFNSENLPVWRARAKKLGFRIAATYKHPNYEGIQFHPADTGGTMFDINRTDAGEDLYGPYGPAGSSWQDHVRTDRVTAITGATLQSEQPERLAARWSALLERPATVEGDRWRIRVADAVINVVEAVDGRGEGLSEVEIAAVDSDAIRKAAARLACLDDNGQIHVAGVRFTLRAAL